MAEKRPAEDEVDDVKAKKRWQVFAHATSIIKVYVGKDKVDYQVHESVLVQCSWFKKCLSSGMREQQEKKIDLEEDDADDIDILLRWLYGEKEVNVERDILRVASAYNTADKYRLPELQNALIDTARKICVAHRLNPREAMIVWGGAPEGSKLRTLMVNQLHYDICTSSEEYKSEGEKVGPYGRELITLMEEKPDMAHALYWKMHKWANTGNRNRQQTPVNPGTAGACFYHVHVDGKRCA
ncbi:hypothetical protein H2200_011889 [Cladophialophora chaetospira]|uniref:BTB domain-containing protein n=1 Tax=Cladophialophora chaetospira TaxID=386627 RepID=A0AA38WZ10_9EURO|nr:hypothetical protein H2200_011889 [Cladophialophora chaetospira]